MTLLLWLWASVASGADAAGAVHGSFLLAPKQWPAFSKGCGLGGAVWQVDETRRQRILPDVGFVDAGRRIRRRRQPFFAWETSAGNRMIPVRYETTIRPALFDALTSWVVREVYFETCGVPPLTEAAWHHELTKDRRRWHRHFRVALLAEWWLAMAEPQLDPGVAFELIDECLRRRGACEPLAAELAQWSLATHGPDALQPRPRTAVQEPSQ